MMPLPQYTNLSDESLPYTTISGMYLCLYNVRQYRYPIITVYTRYHLNQFEYARTNIGSHLPLPILIGEWR